MFIHEKNEIPEILKEESFVFGTSGICPMLFNIFKKEKSRKMIRKDDKTEDSLSFNSYVLEPIRLNILSESKELLSENEILNMAGNFRLHYSGTLYLYEDKEVVPFSPFYNGMFFAIPAYEVLINGFSEFVKYTEKTFLKSVASEFDLFRVAQRKFLNMANYLLKEGFVDIVISTNYQTKMATVMLGIDKENFVYDVHTEYASCPRVMELALMNIVNSVIKKYREVAIIDGKIVNIVSAECYYSSKDLRVNPRQVLMIESERSERELEARINSKILPVM